MPSYMIAELKVLKRASVYGEGKTKTALGHDGSVRRAYVEAVDARRRNLGLAKVVRV